MFLHQNLIKIGPREPEIFAVPWEARFSQIPSDISLFVALFLFLQNSSNSPIYFLDAFQKPQVTIQGPQVIIKGP